VGYLLIPSARHLPPWRTDGAVATALLHAGPVEFLYYWFHRALHHHFLYSRYHSHHHSSIVTEPITCKCPGRVISHCFIVLGVIIADLWLCGYGSVVHYYLQFYSRKMLASCT
jgi:sterol desaturase/sphingolipid hydroxylase (fatty acid hydroxylase superfamily)